MYYYEITLERKIFHLDSLPCLFVISPISDQCQINFITLGSTGKSLGQFLVKFYTLFYGDYITLK